VFSSSKCQGCVCRSEQTANPLPALGHLDECWECYGLASRARCPVTLQRCLSPLSVGRCGDRRGQALLCWGEGGSAPRSAVGVLPWDPPPLQSPSPPCGRRDSPCLFWTSRNKMGSVGCSLSAEAALCPCGRGRALVVMGWGVWDTR